MFSHFSNFRLQKLQKTFKQILADLLVITRKDHLTNVPSLIEIHRSNDLKIASFVVFFKILLFEIQSTFLARHHG